MAVCDGQTCGPTQWDRSLLALAAELRSPTLDQLFAAATWGGSLFLLVPLTLCAGLLLAAKYRYRDAVFLAAGLAGASILSHVGKLAVERPRPEMFDAITAMPVDHAFPSAHSAQVTAVALAVFLLARRAHVAHASLLTAALTVMVALVAVSRIYLQVHFPTDVAAGILMSVLWVLGLAAAMLPPAQQR